jgi:hypothetical protein
MRNFAYIEEQIRRHLSRAHEPLLVETMSQKRPAFLCSEERGLGEPFVLKSWSYEDRRNNLYPFAVELHVHLDEVGWGCHELPKGAGRHPSDDTFPERKSA